MSTVQTTQLDCKLSVNAVIARHPSTTKVFNAHGIDTCCGGAKSVEDAAREAGVDPTALCGELVGAIG
jgi:iron-sulfur cluster repair protein YtfE (RIC family)